MVVFLLRKPNISTANKSSSNHTPQFNSIFSSTFPMMELSSILLAISQSMEKLLPSQRKEFWRWERKGSSNRLRRSKISKILWRQLRLKKLRRREFLICIWTRRTSSMIKISAFNSDQSSTSSVKINCSFSKLWKFSYQEKSLIDKFMNWSSFIIRNCSRRKK